jgi:hypothetical protein
MNDEDKISASEIRDETPAKEYHPLLDALDMRTGYSNNILIRMLIVGVILASLIFWKFDLISEIYFRHQIKEVGPLINGGIVALFVIGILKLVVTFLRYAGEEAALARFIKNVRNDAMDPIKRVPTNSIISRRYLLMQGLYEQRALINHSALASMLLANESTRTSMAKFINNILILAGVFGTIVSLSIALLGASNILDASAGTGGMSEVLSGMSTALSTTITAIICYAYFGYFFIKLSDVQTQVINNVEQLTAALLVPKFSVQTDTVMQDVATLARKMQKLVSTLEEAQARYSASGQKLLDAVSSYSIRGQNISNDISIIKELLRSGFRLYEDDAEDEN